MRYMRENGIPHARQPKHILQIMGIYSTTTPLEGAGQAEVVSICCFILLQIFDHYPDKNNRDSSQMFVGK